MIITTQDHIKKFCYVEIFFDHFNMIIDESVANILLVNF